MRQEAWARGRGCVSLSTIRLQGPAVSQQGVAKGFIPVSELCLQLFWLLLSPSCLQSQCSVTLTSSPAMALHNSSLSAPIETAVSPALCSPGAQCQCCPGSLSLSRATLTAAHMRPTTIKHSASGLISLPPPHR